MFVVNGTPRPAAYVAAQIYKVWVQDSAKKFVEVFLDGKTRFIPANLRGPFVLKTHLYCEASVLRVLLTEMQSNPKFETLVVEFERLIFPLTQTSEGMEKLEAIKSAMKNLDRLIFEKKELSWARSWFADIGHDETNPATLHLLVQLLALDTKSLRGLIRDIRPSH
jgi:hypothetical protein